MNGTPRKTSPWVYVGIGCGAALLLGLIAVVGVGVFGYRKAKQFEAELKDPAARASKVRAVLGGDPPPGYHPVMAMSIPFLMDMAMLADQPPDAQGRTPRMDKGFIYVKTLSSGGQEDELKRYFEGKTDDAEVLRRSNIHLNAEEVIRRGLVDIPGQTTMYLAQRGDISMNNRATHSGLTTLVFVDCPQDARQRLGIWFGPDPSPGTPAAEVNWTGSIADEAVMRDFLGHFKLCGGS